MHMHVKAATYLHIKAKNYGNYRESTDVIYLGRD